MCVSNLVDVVLWVASTLLLSCIGPVRWLMPWFPFFFLSLFLSLSHTHSLFLSVSLWCAGVSAVEGGRGDKPEAMGPRVLGTL